jgi:hypothetical protein
MTETMLPPTPLSHPFSASVASGLGLPVSYSVPTQLDIARFELLLHQHPNRELVDLAVAGLKYGFRLGYSGPRDSQHHENLKSANDCAHILRTNIETELEKGRLFKLNPS